MIAVDATWKLHLELDFQPGAQLVQFFGANDYGFVLEKNLRPLADAPAQTLSAAASIALDKAQERVRQIQAPGGVIEAAV